MTTPTRDWWAYLAALIPAHFHLVGHVQAPHAAFPPLAVAITQIGGNFSLAAVTALALRRLAPGALKVDSFRGALTFILVAGIAAPALVNAAVLCIHMATGWTNQFWLPWRQWMLSCIFPTVTIVPLALLPREGRSEPRVSRLQLCLACTGLFVLGFFAYDRMAAPYWPALLLAPLPLLLWAAVRSGVFGANLSMLVFGAAIILGALQHRGPFAEASSIDSVLSLQVYLTAISISLFLLAGLEEDRRRAVDGLRRSEERIQMAAASTDTGLWQWDRATRRLWTTEHCRTMFGSPAVNLETLDAILEFVHPEDRNRVRKALNSVAGAGEADTTGDFRLLLPDGQLRWFTFSTHGEMEHDGRLTRVSGVFRDITQRVAAEARATELSHRLLTLQEEERRTIAEELHDSTGQHLVAMGLSLRAMERRLPLDTEVRRLFVDIQTSLAEALKELRTFTYLLRPPDLQRSGLTDVLERYVEGFGLRTGLKSRLRVSRKADDLPIEQQRAVLRIAQECLANVHRHAAASRVEVSLRHQAEALHIIVRDDGRGMDEAALHNGSGRLALGVGIPGMNARVRELGGRLAIHSGAWGTSVHVAVPMAGVDDAEQAPAWNGAVGLAMSRRAFKGEGAGLRIRAEGR